MVHEIDYKIHGNEMQFVEIMLDPNETVVAEAGAMMMMDNSISMETIFGDGSDKSIGRGCQKSINRRKPFYDCLY